LFVPEVLIAARAMHAAMNVLRPLPTEGDVLSVGKAITGTTKPALGRTLDAPAETGLRRPSPSGLRRRDWGRRLCARRGLGGRTGSRVGAVEATMAGAVSRPGVSAFTPYASRQWR
jgi:hypothetical protein